MIDTVGARHGTARRGKGACNRGRTRVAERKEGRQKERQKGAARSIFFIWKAPCAALGLKAGFALWSLRARARARAIGNFVPPRVDMEVAPASAGGRGGAEHR